MKTFTLLFAVFFLASCNVKVNPTYPYVYAYSVETTYEEALEKIKEMHEATPSYAVENTDVTGIDNEFSKVHQTHFYLSETNQVAVCAFYGKKRDYSLAVMAHFYDLEDFGKLTPREIIKKDTYTQEEIDRYKESKEIFESHILEKFGNWQEIKIQDL
ncbi:hypothetical protein [Prevotella sp. 10(H)]|uniref:hypothetical protein n=1 Tax=Prevotella sp. 10(H) TaxID=1158294 RepID=UPI0004A75F00|nr:hypothetical protein [Prevotella sp. 10(H)]